MKVMDHPYLEGVKCREDGTVFIPQSGTRKAHWTPGTRKNSGYYGVTIFRKQYYVHRLICETFHGPCPEGYEVDHKDRDKSNNRPENLRYVTRSGNLRNRRVAEESLAKYGVSCADDNTAYQLSRYHNNPEHRERVLAYCRARYATDPEFREKVRARSRARYAKKKELKQST